MGRGQELHVRPDLAVLPDGDPGDIQSGQIVVDEGPGTDVDIFAIVHCQRRPDPCPLPQATEQLPQQRQGLSLIIHDYGPVVLVAQPHGALGYPRILRVIGDVQVTREHPFPIRAGIAGEVVGSHAPKF